MGASDALAAPIIINNFDPLNISLGLLHFTSRLSADKTFFIASAGPQRFDFENKTGQNIGDLRLYDVQINVPAGGGSWGAAGNQSPFFPSVVISRQRFSPQLLSTAGTSLRQPRTTRSSCWQHPNSSLTETLGQGGPCRILFDAAVTLKGQASVVQPQARLPYSLLGSLAS